MSQNVKIVKNKKKKATFSDFWNNYIRTLWNNDACVDAAYKTKPYVSIILFIAALLISVIPLVVHTLNTQGGSFLTSTYTYNVDEGVYSFLNDANENNYDIEINNGQASLVGKEALVSENYLIYEHKGDIVDFQVYWIQDSSNYQDLYTKISNLNPNENTARDCSFAIFSDNMFGFYFYKTGTTGLSSTAVCDYENTDVTSLKSLLYTLEDTHLQNVKKTASNLQTFVNDGYSNARKQLVIAQLLLSLGINAGITLLMGLVFWLLTRGKSNPNRDLKFFKSFGITFWTTLTPALLSLILGFMMTGYEIMFYLTTFGFRIMWLSSKSAQQGTLVR